MQSVQLPITGICHDCDGYGHRLGDSRYSVLTIDNFDCESCGGSGLVSQSGDLCRLPAQSSDAVGQVSTNNYPFVVGQ